MKLRPSRQFTRPTNAVQASVIAEHPPRRAGPRVKAEANTTTSGEATHQPVETEEDDELPAREVPGQLGGQHRDERPRAAPEVHDLGRRRPRESSVTTARTIAVSHSSSGSKVLQPASPRAPRPRARTPPAPRSPRRGPTAPPARAGAGPAPARRAPARGARRRRGRPRARGRTARRAKGRSEPESYADRRQERDGGGRLEDEPRLVEGGARVVGEARRRPARRCRGSWR